MPLADSPWSFENSTEPRGARLKEPPQTAMSCRPVSSPLTPMSIV